MANSPCEPVSSRRDILVDESDAPKLQAPKTEISSVSVYYEPSTPPPMPCRRAQCACSAFVGYFKRRFSDIDNVEVILRYSITSKLFLDTIMPRPTTPSLGAFRSNAGPRRSPSACSEDFFLKRVELECVERRDELVAVLELFVKHRVQPPEPDQSQFRDGFVPILSTRIGHRRRRV